MVLFNDQLADSATWEVLKSVHTDPGVESVVAGSIRQLARAVRECEAEISVHVVGQPRDRSERLIRCLARAGSCRTVAAVVAEHDTHHEMALRRAGADMYLVWPEDACVLRELLTMTPTAMSIHETSTSRRECAIARSRLSDRL